MRSRLTRCVMFLLIATSPTYAADQGSLLVLASGKLLLIQPDGTQRLPPPPLDNVDSAVLSPDGKYVALQPRPSRRRSPLRLSGAEPPQKLSRCRTTPISVRLDGPPTVEQSLMRYWGSPMTSSWCIFRRRAGSHAISATGIRALAFHRTARKSSTP